MTETFVVARVVASLALIAFLTDCFVQVPRLPRSFVGPERWASAVVLGLVEAFLLFTVFAPSANYGVSAKTEAATNACVMWLVAYQQHRFTRSARGDGSAFGLRMAAAGAVFLAAAVLVRAFAPVLP